MIALSFHDSGPGFPPALLHKLLDPFFTTKDHGTGLGLPIVNTIITSHNGKLLLTNPEEGGAMITHPAPGCQRAGYRRHSRKRRTAGRKRG